MATGDSGSDSPRKFADIFGGDAWDGISGVGGVGGDDFTVPGTGTAGERVDWQPLVDFAELSDLCIFGGGEGGAGGNGQGGASSGAGGIGGLGGGTIRLAFATMTLTGALTFSANGGDGANGENGVDGAGGGGGGGGAGGVIMFDLPPEQATTNLTLEANPGTFGNGGTASGGSYQDGGNGGEGAYGLVLPLIGA